MLGAQQRLPRLGRLANTYSWIDPTRRVAGVVLTRILPFADAAALDLLAAVERGAYEAAGPA